MPHRPYRYFDLLMVGFVVVLLCSNLIGPAKIAVVDLPGWGPFAFGAAAIFFPISYVFGDILTEVYGYAQARKVIWAGFAALLFASCMAAVVVALPPAPFWPHQGAFELAFGNTWRIVAASIVAYFCGEFVNAYVLAKMKVWTGGRALWSRTIGSTICGEAVDSALFYPLAFYGTGIIPNAALPEVMLAQFAYAVVGYLKRAEGIDPFDRDTDFNPFKIGG
jgi:hypothetical protein